MIKVKVKSLWQNKVAIRDKYLMRALKYKDGLEIHFDTEVMYIPFNEIKNKIAGWSKETVKDLYGKAKHHLVYFLWRPTDVQQSLL
jgi:hypothetical protein